MCVCEMRIVRAGQSAQRERKREEVENMTLEWFASLTLPPPPKTPLSFFLLNYISNDVFVEKILTKREIKR